MLKGANNEPFWLCLKTFRHSDISLERSRIKTYTVYFSRFVCFLFATADLVENVQRYGTCKMYSLFLPILTVLTVSIAIHKYYGRILRVEYSHLFF